MNILLIDNGTLHLKSLQNVLQNHTVTTIARDQLNENNTDNYDLIVLSGSNHSPVVINPEEYTQEITLIKTTNVPIVGICMGFEVIAYTYGGVLEEMPARENGILEIYVTNDDIIFKSEKMFRVEEKHRWVVTKLKSPLIDLATSKDGIEALKHTQKRIYGFQFHPEIFDNNNQGHLIFSNLLDELNNK